MTTTAPLPYSTSSGSAFSACEKLRGASNYHEWRVSTCTLLHTLRQWDVIDGTETAPTPVDPWAPTPDEAAALQAWHVRSWALYIEIMYQCDNTVKTTIGDLEDPKLIWEMLELQYGAKQCGLQSVLCAKLNQCRWDGEGGIMAHRDVMFGLRSELAAAGLSISDQQFYEYFIDSLPQSLDTFVTMYDDPTANVDSLCDRFSRYEMRLRVASIRNGKAEGSSGGVTAFHSQPATSTKDKGKGKARQRDLTDVMCYGCGKKGHLRHKCPDKPKGGESKEEKKDDKPKTEKGKEVADKPKASSGSMYTAVNTPNDESANMYYIDSGASQHLVPTRSDLQTYQEFSTPVEIAAANGGVVYAYGSGMLKVSSSAEGHVAALRDIYYAPGIHTRLVSFGWLLQQGWTVKCSKTQMELRTNNGSLFAMVEMVNNVYPMKLDIAHLSPVLAAWAVEGVAEPAPDELVECLEKVAMVATAKGPDGKRASLMTWHRRLGHSSFKTVVVSTKKGVSGMEISDLPEKTPGLNACTTCIVAKAVHLPHKEG